MFALGETHLNYTNICNRSRPAVETFSTAMLFMLDVAEFYLYECPLRVDGNTKNSSKAVNSNLFFSYKKHLLEMRKPPHLAVQLCHPVFNRLTLMVPWALLSPWLLARTEEWCFAMRGAAADPRGY